MNNKLKYISATSVEPEFLELTIERKEDGEWIGGVLSIDIATAVLITEDGRESVVCGVSINLMRSDLENIAEKIDDARVGMAERRDDQRTNFERRTRNG